MLKSRGAEGKRVSCLALLKLDGRTGLDISSTDGARYCNRQIDDYQYIINNGVIRTIGTRRKSMLTIGMIDMFFFLF